MEGFTLIDAIVAGVILLSAILAYSRGLVREGMSIVSWIGATVIAFIFAASGQPLVKKLPVVGKFLTDSCELSIVTAFALIFVLALIIASLFSPFLSSAIHRTVLGGIDHGLGFLFGAVRGVLLAATAFVVYDRALVSEAIPIVDDSRSAKIFAAMQNELNAQIPTDTPGWIIERYKELTAVCVKAATYTPLEPAPAN